MKLNIACPTTGGQKIIDVDDDKKLRIFYDMRIAQEVDATPLGDEFAGYILRITGGDPEGKVRRLLDYTDRRRDIDDPWYTDDFDTAYREIAQGCEALLASLEK